MAKVIGQSDTGVIVDMAVADAKKVFGVSSLDGDTVYNINPIYNKLEAILAKKTKLVTLSANLRSLANQVDNAIAASELGGL